MTRPIADAHNVLVIEDCRETGSILTRYLSDQVERLARLADPETTALQRLAGQRRQAGPRDRHGVVYRAARNEPGEGQLRHLSPASYGDDKPDPTVAQYPVDDLFGLIAAAQDLDKLRQKVRDKSRELFAASDNRPPDILVVDLALSEKGETKRLVRAGGNEELTDRDADTQTLKRDPRRVLRNVTGFRLMQAFAGECPVIVTTYSRHPLIAQHCLVNGAFAVVQKPVVEGDEDDPFSMHAVKDLSFATLEGQAKAGVPHGLAVLVANYLTQVSGEVLKAMSHLELRHLVAIREDEERVHRLLMEAEADRRLADEDEDEDAA